MEELRRHGYDVSPGTLYPVLHGLEEARYLRHADRVVGGKVRKYYAITPQGRNALALAREQIRELVREVLEDEASAAPAAARRKTIGKRARTVPLSSRRDEARGRGSGDRTQRREAIRGGSRPL
jgi:DNA-binding PadR family transcriptional regulator